MTESSPRAFRSRSADATEAAGQIDRSSATSDAHGKRWVRDDPGFAMPARFPISRGQCPDRGGRERQGMMAQAGWLASDGEQLTGISCIDSHSLQSPGRCAGWDGSREGSLEGWAGRWAGLATGGAARGSLCRVQDGEGEGDEVDEEEVMEGKERRGEGEGERDGTCFTVLFR